MEYSLDRSLFQFTFPLRVRNYEVDWQGIVHNGNYLLYCEVSRVEYLKKLGIKVDISSINSSSRVVLVRNEINYLAPARLDELLNVFTRVASIGNTSFVMEGLVERASNSERLIENVAVHAWLDPSTNTSMRVPDDFRKVIREFEGDRCVFHPSPKP